MRLLTISKENLMRFYDETSNVTVNYKNYVHGFSGCGNNACHGTCSWSPCTNLCAATSH